MKTDELIAVNEICIHHKIEPSFIVSLRDAGLLQITTVDEAIFLPEREIRNLEKMVRLYYEMDINVEGIETITYLLQRLNEMQVRITELSNQLEFVRPTEQ
jgi:hypothetical protein